MVVEGHAFAIAQQVVVVPQGFVADYHKLTDHTLLGHSGHRTL